MTRMKIREPGMLEIAPPLWSQEINDDQQCMVYDGLGHEIMQAFGNTDDACLASAAPELYSLVFEQADLMCFKNCGLHCTEPCKKGYGECRWQKWRTALEKANFQG